MAVGNGVFLILGLYFLIAPKAKICRDIFVQGWHARLAGLALLSPFSVPFVFGALLGLHVLPFSSLSYFQVTYLTAKLAAVVVASVFISRGLRFIAPDEDCRIDK